MFEKTKTPMKRNAWSDNRKKKAIAKHFRSIMQALELDLSDDSLKDTPDRVAKMYVDEVFSGLDNKNFPKITCVDNKLNYVHPVIECNIDLSSNCEHHFVPIIGRVHIAYIPDKKIIGLSKLNRIAKYYAKRPQIQERLTNQISECLIHLLEVEDVAVLIDGVHTCVRTRGIEDTSSITRTYFLGGSFKNNDTIKKELFDSIPKMSDINL